MTTAAPDDYGAGMAFALGKFEGGPEANETTLEGSSPAGPNKRGPDYADGPKTSKRRASCKGQRAGRVNVLILR
jgi:hypothetical protein